MIVVILLIVFGLALFSRHMDKKAIESRKKFIAEVRSDVVGRNCPPHKWTYHPATERLTCTLCNLEAGSDAPRGGSDYDF